MTDRTTRVAQVAPAVPAAVSIGMLQRKCACGTYTQGEEECADCKRNRLQRRAVAGTDEDFEIPPIVDDVLGSPGRALDRHVRDQMESRFNHDFSDVRVHTNATAQLSARSVSALAYTVGHNVVFGSGQYAPDSARGTHLLAHELAHVVQQRGSFGGSGGRVGRPNPALEHDADRAADRVTRGDAAPAIATAPGAMLARQAVPAESSSTRTATRCQGVIRPGDLLRPPPIRLGNRPTGRYTISRVESLGDNRKRVVLSTGQRYIVNRMPWSRTGTGPITRGDTRSDIDATEAWVEFHWCRGSTDGRIRAGANVPEQALQLLRDAIANGGDIAAAWAGASVTPTLAGTFRFGTVDLSLGGQVTVGTDGRVTAGEGTAGVGVDIPGGRVEPTVTVGSDPSRGTFVTGGVTIRWGGSPTQPPRCEEQWVRSGFKYSCEEERDVPPSTRPGKQQVTVTEDRAYNLFFNYAVASFDDGRNAEALTALRTDLGAGFQIQAIEGWTSPEGPMGPGAVGFEGNDTLSLARAEAARTRVNNELCPPSTTCVAPSARVEGRGERLDPLDPVTGERMDVRGSALEQHVDDNFATDSGEASVRSPALMERLRRTPSRRRRAELIYPWLRRAILRLRHHNTSTEDCEFVVPATTESLGIGNCPDDIRRAAYPDREGGP